MSIIDLSLLLIALFFSLYGLACGLECGVGFALLNEDSPRVRKLFTPFWEITNVFLVFGFTALAVLFNNALASLSHKLVTTLAVALIALLLRGCVVLKVFYLDQGKATKGEARLFVLCNFAIPLSFSAAGIYLLTGQYFWQSSLGLAAFASTVVGLAAVGLSFMKLAGAKVGTVADALLAFWLLVLGSILPLVIIHTTNNLKSWPVAALAGLSLVGLLSLGINLLVNSKKLLIGVAAIVSLAALPLLAWADRPYLISGKLSLAQAYGAQAYGSVVVAGLIISLPVILLGFWLFYKLVSWQHRQPESK